MTDIWFLTTIVMLYATVQSLFGVGLLVFGTPTMLLAGYSFETTIAFLLPSSIVISLVQVIEGRERIQRFKKSFLIYSVPFIILGLSIILLGWFNQDVKILVGIVLVVSALVRNTSSIQSMLANFLNKQMKLYLMLMGLIHGLSNMGGGFLTVFITAIYNDKETIRANIAYGYLVFAISQIAVLSVLNPGVLTIKSLLFAGLAFITTKTVGQVIYLKSSKRVYQQLITIFIFTYGVILIGQKFF